MWHGKKGNLGAPMHHDANLKTNNKIDKTLIYRERGRKSVYLAAYNEFIACFHEF